MAPVKYIAHGPHPHPLFCPVFVVYPPTEASFLSLVYEIISLQEVILFSVLFGVFLCCSFARGKIEVLSRPLPQKHVIHKRRRGYHHLQVAEQ